MAGQMDKLIGSQADRQTIHRQVDEEEIRRDEEGEAMFYKIKMNAKAVSLAMNCGVVVCKVCCKSSNLHTKQENHSGP